MWNILSFLKSFCVMVQISALYNSTNMTRVQNTLILVVLNRLSLRTPSYATFGTLSPLSLFGCPPTVCDTENLHFSADCTSNRHLPSSPDTTFLHTFIQQMFTVCPGTPYFHSTVIKASLLTKTIIFLSSNSFRPYPSLFLLEILGFLPHSKPSQSISHSLTAFFPRCLIHFILYLIPRLCPLFLRGLY